jgi:hypothetical protein
LILVIILSCSTFSQTNKKALNHRPRSLCEGVCPQTYPQ